MKLPKVISEWLVITLLAGSGILVLKWVIGATPLANISGLNKAVQSM